MHDHTQQETLSSQQIAAIDLLLAGISEAEIVKYLHINQQIMRD